MATYNEVQADFNNAIEKFGQFEVDEQLALLWFIYEKMGQSITPAAPNAAEPAIINGLFEQVKQQEYEEQLETMRDLVNRKDTTISREYGSLSANSKLGFWYYLAQGMDEKMIIPMPEKYDLSQAATEWIGSVESLDFNQQITVLREIVVGMGAEPASGKNI